MPLTFIPFWKNAPFIRILLPFAVGICLQWYLQLSFLLLTIVFLVSFSAAVIFFFLPFTQRIRLAIANGIFTNSMLAAAAALFTWKQDIRNNELWFARSTSKAQQLAVTLTEDPVEKAKSYKATASVDVMLENGNQSRSAGNIILYFAKDSFQSRLRRGAVILVNKQLQEINSTGNPGSFDYKQYSLFKGITHQVYLTPKDYHVLAETKRSFLTDLLSSIRSRVLATLRKYIPGEKERGLAEALLIGYKDDLDKTLVQSYSNTGVVHIIAISGLHLGLIYWLLVQLLKPLNRKKQAKWLNPVLIISGLWLFSLLAGAQPSVLRSAVMFTCIVIGESINRKTSIYNSLAASAFMLLCYNPFWLWDVGFQLSYAAVLSIVIFMQPVYNWFYIKNKLLDFLWKMTAVTIAAQILTTPISLFHFHQFPVYFLFTNFIAVPLSSVILFGEIALCIFSWLSPLATVLGKILQAFIWFMNTWVKRVESLPFSLWDNIQITILQATLLLLAISLFSYWLLEKNTRSLIGALSVCVIVFTVRAADFILTSNQQQLIIYNVPGKKAIDIVSGDHFSFIGDTSLLSDDFARNFHIKPARTLFRMYNEAQNSAYNEPTYLSVNDKHIVLLNKAIRFKNAAVKEDADLLILSGKPKLDLAELANNLSIKQIVFDGSVPAWKSKSWKQACDSLHIAWHDVADKGAFVMNLR